MDNIDTINMELPLSAVFALLGDEYGEKTISSDFIGVKTIEVTKRGSTHYMCIAYYYDTPDDIFAVVYDERDDEYAKIIRWEAEVLQCTPESIAVDIEKYL